MINLIYISAESLEQVHWRQSPHIRLKTHMIPSIPGQNHADDRNSEIRICYEVDAIGRD